MKNAHRVSRVNTMRYVIITVPADPAALQKSYNPVFPNRVSTKTGSTFTDPVDVLTLIFFPYLAERKA